MAHSGITNDLGGRNRKLVLSQILRSPGISRTEIGEVLALNPASVSRISRDLIGAGLIHETDRFGPKDRPGRRFVGLAPRGAGGFVVGIGINAFRQSVTLADLENTKIAEWVADAPPGSDGAAFIRLCLEMAEGMVHEHVTDPTRFFGVGMAIAADIDPGAGIIHTAPVFGWNDPIEVARTAQDILGAPLSIDTPSSAINKAEGDFGLGKGIDNLTNLHCSIGFGIGVRRQGSDGGIQDLGAVLTHSKAPDGSGRSLTEACGGYSVLMDRFGLDAVSGLSDTDLGLMLVDTIAGASRDAVLADILAAKGQRTAQHMSLVLDICQPDRLLLSGPLAASPHYVDGFSNALPAVLANTDKTPEIKCSDMTPTGASRWLALRTNVGEADLDLDALRLESAA